MPDPKKPASIAASTPYNTRPVPVSKFENQQPDPVQSILDIVGHPFENMELGGPTHAVAAVAPEWLGKLRARSAELMKMLAERRSLERRSIGMPLKVENPSLLKGAQQYETVPLNEEMLDVLRYAQQRYPRLFAHNMDITDIDALTRLQTAGQTVFGSSSAAHTPKKAVLDQHGYVSYPPDAQRLIPGIGAGPFRGIAPTDIPVLPHKIDAVSNLQFNTPDMNRTRFAMYSDKRPGQMQYPYGRPHADIIGHELSHSADRLTMGQGKLQELYEYANSLPGGYANNSQEIRARMNGAEFNRQYQEWVAAGRPQNKFKLSKSDPNR